MPQDLQAVADVAISEAALALRNQSTTPRLVSQDLQGEAAQKNDTIFVPVWPAIPVQDVTPGRGNENTPTVLTPDRVPVVLDQFKETRFSLSDREMAEIMDARVLPEVMIRSVISHADNVDSFVLTKMNQAAWNSALAGTPAATADLIAIRKLLNKQNVPRDRNRFAIHSDDIAGELLLLPLFHAADQRGDTLGITEGDLGRKFGLNHSDNGQMPSHVEGDAATFTVNGNQSANPFQSGGHSIINVTAGTGSHTVGDTIKFANHAQNYNVVTPIAGQAAGTIRIMPSLQVNIVNTEAISYIGAIGDHAAGTIAFHRSAFAFAARPLQTQTTPGVIISQANDPLSGISLRVTIEYVNKSLEWSVDMLFGGEVVTSEAIAKLRD